MTSHINTTDEDIDDQLYKYISFQHCFIITALLVFHLVVKDMS